MNPPTPQEWWPPERVVAEHVAWWTDHVYRRLLGNARRAKGHSTGQPKPAWNEAIRAQFVRGLASVVPDYPAAELADLFEQAVTAANGNPVRFRQELGRLLR